MSVKACFLAFALLCGFASVAGAQPTEEDCSQVCNAGSSCATQCRLNGDWSNCGGYGVCNQDPDGDGVVNDNCPYHYNPNQADCDADGAGDACDGMPGIFQQVSPTVPCYIVDRLHFGYRDQRLFEEGLFRDISNCNRPDEWRKVGERTGTCWFSLATSATVCCQSLWVGIYGSSVCSLIGNNQCHF